MACNSSASETMVEEHDHPPSKKPYSIKVEADGTVWGKDASKFRSRCGALIRSLVPISYKDWRLVDDAHMKDFWKTLFKEFDMNIKPQSAPKILRYTLSQFFRTQKHTLRKHFIRTAANKQDAIAARPDDIDEVVWEKFVDNEWDEKQKEQCKINALNKAKNTITHSLGRKPYSHVYEDISMENPGVKPSRSAAWKKAHMGKDGKVLPSAQEKWDAIVAAEMKRKATSANEPDSDIEHDELAEVFGPDKNSRCRAMSSNSSVKKVKFQQAVKEITQHKSVVMHEEYQARMEATMKATIEASVRTTVQAVVKESMKELATLIGIQQSMKGASNQVGDTIRTEGASTSFRDQTAGKNFSSANERVSNPTPTSGRRYVMLLSRDENEVAKAYIENRNICHGREVARDERVVWVTEVMDPEARIYEAPQDGNYKLCELVDGGFLIWLEGRLRYL